MTAVRTPVVAVRALVDALAGDPEDAQLRLLQEADRLVGVAPADAARLLVDRAVPLGMLGRTREILRTVERARELSERAGAAADADAQRLAAAHAHALAAIDPAAAAGLLDARAGRGDIPIADPQHGLHLGRALALLEHYDEVEDAVGRMVAAARAAATPGMLPLPLGALGEGRFRRCDWNAADAALEEAVELGDGTGQEAFTAFWRAVLTRLCAARGESARCRHHLERAGDAARRLRLHGVSYFLDTSRGLLALAEGDPAAAAEALAAPRGHERADGALAPNLGRWRPEMVEALVALDRRAEAEDVAAPLEAAGTSQGTWTAGVAARCRARLEQDHEAALAHALEAIALHDPVTDRFDAARARLLAGRRLRRLHRIEEARLQLGTALADFEALRAEPWARRCREALRATGVAAEPRPVEGLAALTTMEYQVAEVVARGARNREAAAELFLSPKTVANHLGRVYRKLGVRSRSELALLLAAAPGEGRADGW